MSLAIDDGNVRSTSGPCVTTEDEFDHWWSQQQKIDDSTVYQVDFDSLDAWRFDPESANLGHRSGQFFTVEGLQVTSARDQVWSQPIINQPEIGILGIVVRRLNGVIHCLMQAKMEPGNINGIQLSPSVQATRSNYTRVHQGAPTEHLDYFVGSDRGEVIVDVLQSEQGAWFWRKRNRNMVVQIDSDPVLTDKFCWISMPCLLALLRRDSLVNMDARTVLSCMPVDLFESGQQDQPESDGLPAALLRSYRSVEAAPHTSGEILSWFTEAKTLCDWSARLVPLRQVRGWAKDKYQLVDTEHQQFRIIGVSVVTGGREVVSWTQPLLEPLAEGLATLAVRQVDGTAQVLVQARQEYGLMDMVELAPTAHVNPGQEFDNAVPAEIRLALADERCRIAYSQTLSEEGGRFYRALTRYRIVEVPPDSVPQTPVNYRWLTVGQLGELLRHGHYLNVQLRSLLACLPGLL